MKVLKFDKGITEYEAPGQPGRRVRILATPENMGTKNISMGMSIYGIGMGAPWHTHKGEELIIVVHGKGKFRSKKEGGEIEEVEASPGTILLFLPSDEHNLENIGSQTLEFIFVYSPPGDESPIKENWIPHKL